MPQFNVPREIDPFVQRAIGATNGSLYQHLAGNMKEYPIPHLRLPAGDGKLFLEIGCSWGRWCIAAARQGYRPVGVDPSLKGIRAARRVAAQLGIHAHYIVADGRHLPFADETFSQAFSYSVLQHISRDEVRSTLAEIHRVLRPGGGSLVQMPNVFGIRCLYHQVAPPLLRSPRLRGPLLDSASTALRLRRHVGPSRISVDGYFSLNAQFSDLRFLPWKYQSFWCDSPSCCAAPASQLLRCRISPTACTSHPLKTLHTRQRPARHHFPAADQPGSLAGFNLRIDFATSRSCST